MTDTFSVYYYMMSLAVLSVVYNVIDDALLIIIIFLREKDIFGAICDTAPKRYISGISAHYLDDTASLMR